jgi:meso-butanediol dehydrogenase / (S,S)-butanediol dehydrogenase / diacetyl reductase
VIISVSSAAAWLAMPGCVAHSAAKGGVVAMSQVFALEGAPSGIRAVTISPGAIVSPGSDAVFADPAVKNMFLQALLVKRLGKSEEVAALAAFLASDDAGFITGTDSKVDGGQARLASTEALAMRKS